MRGASARKRRGRLACRRAQAALLTCGMAVGGRRGGWRARGCGSEADDTTAKGRVGEVRLKHHASAARDAVRVVAVYASGAGEGADGWVPGLEERTAPGDDERCLQDGQLGAVEGVGVLRHQTHELRTSTLHGHRSMTRHPQHNAGQKKHSNDTDTHLVGDEGIGDDDVLEVKRHREPTAGRRKASASAVGTSYTARDVHDDDLGCNDVLTLALQFQHQGILDGLQVLVRKLIDRFCNTAVTLPTGAHLDRQLHVVLRCSNDINNKPNKSTD